MSPTNAQPIETWNNKKKPPQAKDNQNDQQVAKQQSAPASDEIVFSDKHSLSDYIIGKQIGQGAYAVVRIGMHKKLNKKVALKIYEKEKIKDIQRKKSVRREIRLMKRLNHPHIATLYEAIETEE
jgi:serine/threonine protein kinase